MLDCVAYCWEPRWSLYIDWMKQKRYKLSLYNTDDDMLPQILKQVYNHEAILKQHDKHILSFATYELGSIYFERQEVRNLILCIIYCSLILF